VLPPIPDCVWSVVGAIPVTVGAHLLVDGEIADGVWLPRTREIKVELDQSALNRWRALFHEWVHSLIDDNEIPVRGAVEERICNVVANGLIAQATSGVPFLVFPADPSGPPAVTVALEPASPSPA
jgi:hypothetical protein